MDEQTIEQKIAEQDIVLKTLYQQNKKTNRYLLWLRVLSIIKLLLILAPIVLGIIYLPPFFEKAMQKYRQVFPGLQKIEELINNPNPECQCPEI